LQVVILEFVILSMEGFEAAKK